MRKLSLTVALGLTALLGMTACGPSDLPAAATGLVASVEAEALAAMGVEPVDLVAAESDLDATASPTPEAKDKDKVDDRLRNWRKRHALRVALRRDVQHGEAVVETKKGPVTVLVQRGVVTAVDGESITVKSADGFTQTWKYGEKLRVVEKRATIQPTALKTGAQVALAGPKEGGAPTARLIVIPLAR
ncbi:hypothetical protein [Catellatospora sichuanensis]|uniref:hypothetical protein n=1 Tax=Catellatospora sichuanensis TaxID=1969805 RepID=UPI0011824723|nr:hypothetical protein [Catellatospora sichuanensis]